MKPLTPSRGMISGELFAAFVAICYALAGSGLPPVGDGYLYHSLFKYSHPWLWSVMLGVPALLLVIADVRELAAHRRCCHDSSSCWSSKSLEESARWRGRFDLALLFGWAYMLKVLLVDLDKISVMAAVAAGACGFSWWFYKENRRVRRDIRKSNDRACTAVAG